MTVLQAIELSDLASLGPRLVGATFIWTGVIKALEPHIFAGHLISLGWIPRKFIPAAATASAALETALGAGLLVGTAPSVVLPLTLAVLVALSTVSWWGVRSGRTSDCGCYGGYIAPSIGQSLAINGVFALLVALGWRASKPGVGYSAWQFALPLVALGVVALFTHVNQARRAKTGRPLVDLNPLKPGSRFRSAWAGGLTSGHDGEVIVAFLGPDCPYCGNFVKVGNAMVQSPRLPKVVGVVSTPRKRLDSFIDEKGIRFPMAVVSPSMFSRMASAVPTAVLVESGIIKRIWSGNMPPDFVDRFRDAFFPARELANSPPTS